VESIEAYRKDFPILSLKINDYPLNYFDNAATSQKPFCGVIEALFNFFYQPMRMFTEDSMN